MKLYLTYFFSSFCLSLFGLLALHSLRRSKVTSLRRAFLIYSGKSSSGAQLLAGLPIALTIMGVSLLLPVSTGVKVSYFICSAMITFYGYMDDRYELRPIVKLFSQVISVACFSIVSSLSIGGQFSTIVFVVMAFYGVGILNGTNLLDGLDTMSIKLSTLVYSTYIALAMYYVSPVTISFSMISMGAVLAFSFLNKYPSKMHLGEIGGAFIGFTYLFLMTSLFSSLKSQVNLVEALIISVLPMTLSMGEVGISFTRRLMNGKSPFKGDKFHLHHILLNYFKLTPPQTTNILFFSYGTFFTFSLSMLALFELNVQLTYVTLIFMIGAFQAYFGMKYWMKKGFKFSLRNILKSLRKEKLTIIDSSKVDSFEFQIVDGGKKEESDDEKKAA